MPAAAAVGAVVAEGAAMPLVAEGAFTLEAVEAVEVAEHRTPVEAEVHLISAEALRPVPQAPLLEMWAAERPERAGRAVSPS